MNAKTIAIIAVIAIAVIGVAAYAVMGQGGKGTDPVDPEPEITGESMVIYFSATGVTDKVATTIQDLTDSDIYRLVPTVEYTTEDLDRDNTECRAAKECRGDLPLPTISGEKIDLSGYDVIFLGFPIWYKEEPPMITSFLESYNLSGKTVIPFSTSWGTGIANAQSNLERSVQDATWLKGANFTESFTTEEVENWLISIGYLE